MVNLEHMPKQLLHFKGVYGEQQKPFWDSAIYIEPIRKRSAIYNFERGSLFSEGKEITIETPCIIIIPNGVLHGFAWQQNITGSVLTFSLPFYESCLEERQIILNQFQQLQYQVFEKNEIAFKEILFIKENLEKELAVHKVEKQYIITLLFKLLMSKLYRQSIAGQHQVIVNDNRTLTYFNAFQKEITQTIDGTKKIQAYAKKLNITTVHLNRICQSLVQKSALQIVHEKLITQAKKHLLYSNKTISEIAYSLNFKDPSHFSKFFKKMVGVSPRSFRKSQDGYS